MKHSLQEFFNANGQWKDSFSALREILQTTGLQEELKWGKPC